MRFQRQIKELSPGFLRFALLGPKGAMSLTAVDLPSGITGDISYHRPCFKQVCSNTSEHMKCDILVESDCHCSGRFIGNLTTLDDDPIFELLEKLYYVDIEGDYCDAETYAEFESSVETG